MKTPAVKKLRQKLAANQTTYGLWVTLESPSVSEMAVALGLDWILIDAEHGHLDWGDIAAHIRATVRSDTVALVRIAELNVALVKRALDIGADGVVIPWIETREQLEQAVSFARYPPVGVRGIGGERATSWGGCLAQSVLEADKDVMVIPIIESVTGGRNIEQLFNVNGVDVFFLGPADYSSTAGYPGQWEGPGVAEELLKIKDAVRRAGKHCGVMANSSANIRERCEQDFSLISLGMDGGLLLRTLTELLAVTGQSRRIVPSFVPENKPAAAPVVPIKERPAQFAPDRDEVINTVREAPSVTIAPGVIFRPLVGKHNNARNLTTGLVTFLPGAELPYHLHTFTESIMLLSGRAALEVEGRRYTLSNLDNTVLPARVAHYVVNTSNSEDATFHIAMATENPTRELVPAFSPAKPWRMIRVERLAKSASTAMRVLRFTNPTRVPVLKIFSIAILAARK